MGVNEWKAKLWEKVWVNGATVYLVYYIQLSTTDNHR